MAFGAEKGLYVDLIVLFDRTPFAYYFEQNCRNLVISQGKTGCFPVPGVGKLVLQKRKARKGRYPVTGESINIPAKTAVKMRIANACNEATVPPKGR